MTNPAPPSKPTPFPTPSLLRFHPRAASDPSSSNATTTTTGDSTSTKPFFQDPSSVTPSPKPTDEKGVVGKSVLEYAILAVGLVIIGFVFFYRYTRLRRNREPLSRFFALSCRSRSSHSSPHSRFPRTTALSFVPPYSHSQRSQRTRAQDTDAAGRRIGFGGLQISDHDGFIGDKDVLPAYNNAGGPPKYDDLEIAPTSAATVPGPGSGTATAPAYNTDTEHVSPGSRVGPQANTSPTQPNDDTPRGDPNSISFPPAVRLRE